MKFFLFFLVLVINPCASVVVSKEAKSDSYLRRINKLLSLKQEEGFIPVSFRKSFEANRKPTSSIVFEDLSVQIAEKKFTSFCQKEDSYSSIPRIIHLIWLGSPIPFKVKLAVESWRKHHLNWVIKVWTDEDLGSFTWSNPRSETIFNLGKNWAEKSDILRFEILYQFGGIYADTDMICLKSLDSLIDKGLTFFAGFECNYLVGGGFNRVAVGSALIGAEINSPVLQRCIDFTLSLQEAPEMMQSLRSGPGPLSKAAYEALESGEDHLLLFPCSYFYPFPYPKKSAWTKSLIACIRPESFTVHLWEGSWL